LLRPAAGSTSSTVRTGWPESRAWHQRPGTRVASAVTITDRNATTADCCGPATSPRKWHPGGVRCRRRSTTGNGLRGRTTSRRSWPWLADVLTCSGRCFETAQCSAKESPRYRDEALDNFIEIPPVLQSG